MKLEQLNISDLYALKEYLLADYKLNLSLSVRAETEQAKELHYAQYNKLEQPLYQVDVELKKRSSTIFGESLYSDI